MSCGGTEPGRDGGVIDSGLGLGVGVDAPLGALGTLVNAVVVSSSWRACCCEWAVHTSETVGGCCAAWTGLATAGTAGCCACAAFTAAPLLSLLICERAHNTYRYRHNLQA